LRQRGVTCFLAGAGPGDPDLLTIKTARLLSQADYVLHDSLVDARILALAPQAELIDTGKRCGRHSATQEDISAALVRYAAIPGRITLRLKGGDPMIFGRATEEMAALEAAGIPYEIIPGITAASAAAASLHRSLTQRGIARSLHIFTGHGAESGLPAHDWISLTKSGGTLAVYMGGKTLAGLASHFIEAGMSPFMPAIAIENASLPAERIIQATIGTLPALVEAAAPSGPVLVLIGEALRKESKQEVAFLKKSSAKNFY
jgi:uroporphyrin-III C-methyltransferase/precorrin-2 dehydrogenase/sirohydrochlorin ferrochelatase/uroporphyrin-III C-methyltransferase